MRDAGHDYARRVATESITDAQRRLEVDTLSLAPLAERGHGQRLARHIGLEASSGEGRDRQAYAIDGDAVTELRARQIQRRRAETQPEIAATLLQRRYRTYILDDSRKQPDLDSAIATRRNAQVFANYLAFHDAKLQALIQ